MENKDKNKSKGFESQLKRLEEIVEFLDRSDVPLEELLQYYEEGMELAHSCREFLEKAEQKVIDISKKNAPGEGIINLEPEAEDDMSD